jgi:hypothetical protein
VAKGRAIPVHGNLLNAALNTWPMAQQQSTTLTTHAALPITPLVRSKAPPPAAHGLACLDSVVMGEMLEGRRLTGASLTTHDFAGNPLGQAANPGDASARQQHFILGQRGVGAYQAVHPNTHLPMNELSTSASSYVPKTSSKGAQGLRAAGLIKGNSLRNSSIPQGDLGAFAVTSFASVSKSSFTAPPRDAEPVRHPILGTANLSSISLGDANGPLDVPMGFWDRYLSSSHQSYPAHAVSSAPHAQAHRGRAGPGMEVLGGTGLGYPMRDNRTIQSTDYAAPSPLASDKSTLIRQETAQSKMIFPMARTPGHYASTSSDAFCMRPGLIGGASASAKPVIQGGKLSSIVFV